MTSTSTFPGMDTDSKPSSRVLNPPGGASSNIFGGYDERPQQPTKKASGPTRVEEQSPEVSSSVDNSEPSQKNGTQEESPKPADTKPETDSPRDAQSSYKKRDSTHNPINWSASAAASDESSSDADRFKPSKRYYSQEKESYNPITGEMIGSGDTKPVHTSTKVHHPPGGKSTALW